MAESLRILVKAGDDKRETALLFGGKLVEYYRETEDETTLVNAVFLGRVERVLPDMKTAFVKIGQKLNGFLPLAEMDSFHSRGEEKPLVTGKEVLVQVKKDARSEKGAFLTRDIALPGQYLICMPNNRYVGVSKRVTEETDRRKLTAMGAEIGAGKCGLIMRYAALAAKKADVLKELATLAALWADIQKKAEFAKAPAMLYREPNALAALTRDYAPRYALRVTCNNAVNRMPSPPTGLMWEQVSDTELEADWKAAKVEAQLTQALARRVELANGGSLVIDEREALSTIDVNSGRYTGGGGETLALTQNLAACAEIARQIRLRNISGILLIDFIDMETDAEREQVAALLEKELVGDRVKTVLHGFTSLGLLELTRKRTGATLREALLAPCNCCGGTGYRKPESRRKKPRKTETDKQKGNA